MISFIFPYDYIIIIIVSLIILISFLKGFIQSIFALLTWVGSILITIYSYENISEFIYLQLIKISIFTNYEYITNILSIIIAIPVIFIITLFVLKKIRNLLNKQIDKNFLGLFFDKIFGLIYGIIFSYSIITAFLIIIEKYEINNLDFNINNYSNIILKINTFNKEYIYFENEINLK